MTETERDELLALVSLNQVPGLGPARIRALADAFGGLHRALHANPERWRNVPGIGPRIAEAMEETRRRFDPAAEVDRAREAGIELLTPARDVYPRLLREIGDPPPLLYVRGRLGPQDDQAVAVVGTRRCTHYGRLQAERLSRALAGAGITVVSGLARGIDTAAHRACLEAGGRTVAVLGSGLDRPYPPENAGLLERVAQNGAVVSEFPLGAPPHRSHFPRRNRIISGLALGVVVVEASLRSGSLITARWAGEQNREVFAVPGSVDSGRASGTHALIKDGAKLVERIEDVLEELLPALRAAVTEAVPLEPPKALQASHRAILDVLGDDPVVVDEVVERSGLGAAEVLGALFLLEMRRLVRQFPGRRFARR